MSQIKGNKTSIKLVQDKAKPRLIGQVTIAMIIGLIVFGIWKQSTPNKITVERRIETSGESNIERKPKTSDLFSWSSQLKLTPRQKELLEKLLQEERLELAPIHDKLQKVTEDFNKFVEEHKENGIDVNQIRVQAQPISQLSRQKRQIEQAYAIRSIVLLDAQQKKIAEQLVKSTGAKGFDKGAVSP